MNTSVSLKNSFIIHTVALEEAVFIYETLQLILPQKVSNSIKSFEAITAVCSGETNDYCLCMKRRLHKHTFFYIINK